MKLYLIEFVGDIRDTYCIADNTDEAYTIVRQHLDDVDYSFENHRCLKCISLVAEQRNGFPGPYTNMVAPLIIKK